MGHLLFSLYMNRSITKKFPIERIPERTDSSIRNLGEVEYDKQSKLQRQKNQARPKKRNEGHLLLSMYINRFITKNFLIEILTEMINSSARSHGEVKYNKQNCLQHQKNPVRLKSRSEVYLPLALYINWFIPKKFLIETLVETIDSCVTSHGEVKYDTQN